MPRAYRRRIFKQRKRAEKRARKLASKTVTVTAVWTGASGLQWGSVKHKKPTPGIAIAVPVIGEMTLG